MKKTTVIGLAIICILSGCAGKHRQAEETQGSGYIDAQGKNGETSLIRTVKLGNIRLVQWLLLHGADGDIKDHSGKSAVLYAFESEHAGIFRLLVEHGYPKNADLKPVSKIQRQMAQTVHEKHLFEQIRSKPHHNVIPLYDRYFSEFPGGLYRSEVESLFREVVKADSDFLKRSASRSRLKRFIDTYSGMGKNAYRISTASAVIRSGRSATDSVSGTCFEKDRVYVYEIRDGMLRTQSGWISKNAATRIQPDIPVIAPYISEARKMLSQLAVSGAVSAGSEQNAGAERKIKNRTPEKPQKELDALLVHPTLSKLEAYILKYQTAPDCYNLVNTARELYKQMLLKE